MTDERELQADGAPREDQIARRVLVVRPVRFGHNPQTAETNAFRGPPSGDPPERVQARALGELEGLVELLRSRGVEVIVVDDTREPHTPDSIFPNNWISFHADAGVVLYPMHAPNRRLERRPDVCATLEREHGLRVGTVVDLTAQEKDGRALEGTGSVVLDRAHRVAYACLSPRTHPQALGEFGRRLGYEIVAFRASDARGFAIYHTNVLMSIGEAFTVVCTEAIADAGERRAVEDRLEDTGHELVAITAAQMGRFAANLLQVRNAAGDRFVVLSAQALASLDLRQRQVLERHGELLTPALDTIESAGGGSARCMLAEVFLPRARGA